MNPIGSVFAGFFAGIAGFVTGKITIEVIRAFVIAAGDLGVPAQVFVWFLLALVLIVIAGVLESFEELLAGGFLFILGYILGASYMKDLEGIAVGIAALVFLSIKKLRFD